MDTNSYVSLRARYEELIDQEFTLLRDAITYALAFAPQVTSWRDCQLYIHKNGLQRFGPDGPDMVRNDTFARLGREMYAGVIDTLTLDVSSDCEDELWAAINGVEHPLNLAQVLDLNEYIHQQLQPYEPEPQH